MGVCVVGVDLAGSSRRVTGLCSLSLDLRCELAEAKLDEEVLHFILERMPKIVAIDAPLSFPSSGRGLRRCDRELLRMGLRPLPPILGPMRMLTERAIRLKRVLEGFDYKVIEVFPTGARRILGLPSKRDLKALRLGLISLGMKDIPEEVNMHLLDAVICAFVGMLYLRGEFVEVGDEEEGVIIMPRPSSSERGSP
ncbi:MAG: DUF429 domain-containing protein [Nitrososphaerota archaeon]|nr:DUF429 domain-containing protein [Nitrososphaerota archaeon]